MVKKRPQQNRTGPHRLWPLLAVNFFMADMQSGIGPFVGVFLLERGWASGMIGTALSIGNIAGMLIATPVGGFIDTSSHKRAWVIVPGIAVVAASSIILVWQNFWAVSASQIATSIAGAAIVPAVTGITLGMVGQRGFNRQNGRNQAFNHAGNMVGAALSGLLGWQFGYFAVFVLAAVFGAIAITSVLMIPPAAIDDRAARGSKEDDPDSEPHGLTVLVKHKPLLVLALALALFHLGNAAIVPLYGMTAVLSSHANGPGFVATTIVIAQGVMVVASLVAMQVVEKKNYWSDSSCLFSGAADPRPLCLFPHELVGHHAGRDPRRHRHRPAERGGARHGRALALRHRPRQSRARRGHHRSGRGRGVQSGAGRLDRGVDRVLTGVPGARRFRPPCRGRMGRARQCREAVLAKSKRTVAGSDFSSGPSRRPLEG